MKRIDPCSVFVRYGRRRVPFGAAKKVAAPPGDLAAGTQDHGTVWPLWQTFVLPHPGAGHHLGGDVGPNGSFRLRSRIDPAMQAATDTFFLADHFVHVARPSALFLFSRFFWPSVPTRMQRAAPAFFWARLCAVLRDGFFSAGHGTATCETEATVKRRTVSRVSWGSVRPGSELAPLLSDAD